MRVSAGQNLVAYPSDTTPVKKRLTLDIPPQGAVREMVKDNYNGGYNNRQGAFSISTGASFVANKGIANFGSSSFCLSSPYAAQLDLGLGAGAPPGIAALLWVLAPRWCASLGPSYTPASQPRRRCPGAGPGVQRSLLVIRHLRCALMAAVVRKGPEPSGTYRG